MVSKNNIQVEYDLQQVKLLFEAGHVKEAEKLCFEILAAYPNSPLGNFNLGQMMLSENSVESSLPFFKTALESAPEEPKYWLTYIDTLIQAKLYEEAEIVLSCGMQAGLTGREVESLEMLLRNKFQAISLTQKTNTPPSYIEEELIQLFSEFCYEEVESRIMKLVQEYPSWLVGWKILSDTLLVQGKDARLAAQRALELNQHDAKEHCYLGLVLKKEGDLRGAASAFEQAVLLKPDYAAAYNNLGIVYKDMGDVERGIFNYRRALKLNPLYANCFSNLLFCLSHAEKIDSKELFKEHRLFAKYYEWPLKPRWPKHSNLKDYKRCLEVGFVSADFRDHSLAYFFEPILRNLSLSSNLSLHAYSASNIEDKVTGRLRENFKYWNKVDLLSDDDLATKILSDKIDILVDLDGHTSGNRLLTFALKPAPIQASWLGYLATTGLTSMDYYFADSYLLPPYAFDSQFTEKIVQLPANAPFMPSEFSPEVNGLPAFANGHITFGCFNRPNKITQSVVKLWCLVLTALPNSKFLLGAMPQEGSYDAIVNWFVHEGIDKNRLIFHTRGLIVDYLKLHHEVDVCLDTFPSNGVTTTCHAAWMGVPTLCIEGERLTSRGALGVMNHVGLNDFVASNEVDFVRKALYWANHLEQLEGVRQKLRGRFKQSQLSKPDVIAKGLEIAFQQMWKKWCLQLPAESIQISIPAPLK